MNNLAKRVKRVRLPVISQLPDPRSALRRQAQLGSTHDDHTPLVSDAPLSMVTSTAMPASIPNYCRRPDVTNLLPDTGDLPESH